MLVVQKFGGSSVGDVECVRNVASRVSATLREGHKVVVVVSAMGHETDELLGLAPQVSHRAAGAEMDTLITAGEHKSMALLCLALQDQEVGCCSFSGGDAGIRTDCNHGQAGILEVQPERILRTLERGCTPVIGGAQGLSSESHTTFLGRGGSDTTAVAVAAAVHADLCELFTDVDGVMTADPRIVPDARLIERVSYAELLAMCRAGCPKPATRAVEYAERHGVTLRVRRACSTSAGTLVDDGERGSRGASPAIAVVSTHGSIEPDLEAEPATGWVSVIATDPSRQPEVLQRARDALAGTITTRRWDSGGLRTSALVPGAELDDAVLALHREFNLAGEDLEEAARDLAPA